MSYKKPVICEKDSSGKCNHEMYPGIYHIEIFTPGFENCVLYGLEETSIIRRSHDWPQYHQYYENK